MDKEHAALVERLRIGVRRQDRKPAENNAAERSLAHEAADAIEALSRQLDAARAEGFAEAQEAAANTAVETWHHPEAACDDQYTATAIRALQPKEGLND